jgi:hypothetical protein
VAKPQDLGPIRPANSLVLGYNIQQGRKSDFDRLTDGIPVEVCMRKAVLVLGICILAAPAFAGGGYSLFGSYGSVDNHEFAVGAGARLTLGGDRWVGDLTWTWYQEVSGVGTVAGFDDNVQVIPTELGIRLLMNPRGKVIPYLGGGLSFFYVNLNDGSASSPVGGYAMFGINFGAKQAKFFAEALYRYGQSDVSYKQAGDQRVTGTMDVGGFAANVGIAWTF